MKIVIDSLDVNAPEDIRTETMEQIIKDKNFDLTGLMRPPNKENCWQFCALTIREINNERLYKHTYEMLEWLQDITWPGAIVIMEKLVTFPRDILEPDLIKAKHAAELAEDSTWGYSLHIILEKAIAKKKYGQL